MVVPFGQRLVQSGLIVHSDQGFQYTSYAYHDMLPKVSAQISMTWKGNGYDHASMKSFISHLKTKGLYPSYPKFGRGTKAN
ncbi:hypothetical protein [Paenibacillus alvei]|uniref:hypothetical protein n=1 Tax=Paenibacillus alvei TaxID=44250 RepID=UPI00227E0530|nr:hypothetical protein [Paenibacillus alvei]MCY7487588.1 hypothetical protein [Paenibacillus alvei]